MHWLLEIDVFGEREKHLAEAARGAGDKVSRWKDDWWDNRRFPVDEPRGVLFHGSLGNAARIRAETEWTPGAFCDVAAFTLSRWMNSARRWLLNHELIFTTVRKLVDAPQDVLAMLGSPAEIFVRPDSPLKPFSGRVVSTAALSPATFDHGYYFDDLDLPIAVARKRELGEEFRLVVVDRRVVAGSAYAPDGREPGRTLSAGETAWSFAEELARAVPAPEDVYVLDVCETRDGFRLLELNPFSGADLYHCDPAAIVRAIKALLGG